MKTQTKKAQTMTTKKFTDTLIKILNAKIVSKTRRNKMFDRIQIAELNSGKCDFYRTSVLKALIKRRADELDKLDKQLCDALGVVRFKDVEVD